MRLRVNGRDEEYPDVKTAADLLSALDVMRERVAVMVNGDVVRRALLAETPLHEGDTVEVITMVGGG